MNEPATKSSRFPPVKQQVAQVLKDIARRKQELEDDLSSNIMLENRIISERMSMIQGLQKHLSHARHTKQAYNFQEVPDEFSHGSVTRGQLHRRNLAKS